MSAFIKAILVRTALHAAKAYDRGENISPQLFRFYSNIQITNQTNHKQTILGVFRQSRSFKKSLNPVTLEA